MKIKQLEDLKNLQKDDFIEKMMLGSIKGGCCKTTDEELDTPIEPDDPDYLDSRD